jgi:hypothetical protein
MTAVEPSFGLFQRGHDSTMPTVMLTAKSVLALPAPEGAGRIDYWDEKAAGLS